MFKYLFILSLMLSSSLSMAKILTDREVQALLIKEGFPLHVVPTMVCISVHESAHNSEVMNINTDGSIDFGLFQINSKWWGKYFNVNKILQPEYNVKIAQKVYDKQGLSAWVAYNKNKYKCDNYIVK